MLNRRHTQFDRARGVGPASFAGNACDLTVGFLLQEMLQAFDLVGAGLGIVDLDGRLLHSNALAEEILARRFRF